MKLTAMKHNFYPGWPCLLLAATITGQHAAARLSAQEASSGAVGAGRVVRRDRPTGDMFCGPRSAKYVLDHYGKRAELLELVAEIQQRDWSQGSTLADIDKALRSRGLHTAAMRLAPSADLCWPGLAVVHLKAEGAEIGHFVVQLPSDQNASGAEIWRGLRGLRQVSSTWLRNHRSGAVLLVSDSPIADATQYVGASGEEMLLPALLGGLALILIPSRRAWARIARSGFPTKKELP